MAAVETIDTVLLDGNAIAAQIRELVKEQLQSLLMQYDLDTIKLAIVQVRLAILKFDQCHGLVEEVDWKRPYI